MHHSPSLLLADLGDVLSGLLPIILFVLYGIAQLVGNLQQEKRKAPPRPRPVQPPQEFGGVKAAPNAAPGNQPNLEETLRREVEEFLRRAQGQPQQQQRKGHPPQRPAQRPQRGAQRPTLPQVRRQPEQPAKAPEQPRRLVDTQRPEHAAPAAPPGAQRPLSTPSPLGAGVSLHSQTLVDHAHALGADVALADERMEAHLRQRFEHQVGAIAPSATLAQRAATATAAQQLRTMLSTPESVRQIIIASEILRRPEERRM
jgi:DNA primase